MYLNQTQNAVSLALGREWNEAIKVNKELLKTFPDDIDALNRLAKAYFESGDIKRAKTIAAKVLKVNPTDSIASKNLWRWKSLTSGKKSSPSPPQAVNFIEEPGKTKIVSLLNLGDKKVIAKLNAGEEVKIAVHTHRVCVLTFEGKYLGRLPDDLAARLIRLTNSGNLYRVFLKCLEADNIKVFIRESLRAKKMTKVLSFPPETAHDSEPLTKAPANF